MEENKFLIEAKITCIQGLVRFFALYQIKPHTPPLIQSSVSFFEF